jgi:hypothetical protein
MSTTFGESTSGRLSDFEYKSRQLWVWSLRWYKGVGEIHINKGRVGEESKGKETDGCPLTLSSPSTEGQNITTVSSKGGLRRCAPPVGCCP